MTQVVDFSLKVTPQAYFYAAFMLIVIPLPWIVAWFLAALIHEFYHCIVTVLLGKRIYSLEIGLNGAQIYTEPLSEVETLLCALAGPFGGILLISLSTYIPRIAVCALFQSAFNLLPVYPLDGGRALLSIARHFLKEETAAKACAVIRLVALIIIVAFAAVVSFHNKGALPLLLAIALAVRMMKIKIPCK